MSTIRINCPFCKAPVEISATNRPDVQCTHCGNVWRLPPPAMNVEYGWYFIDRKKPVGPISREKLQERAKARLLKPADMIRQEGNQKWQEARSVTGLFPAPARSLSRKKKWAWLAGSAAAVLLAALLLIGQMSSQNRVHKPNPVSPQVALKTDAPEAKPPASGSKPEETLPKPAETVVSAEPKAPSTNLTSIEPAPKKDEPVVKLVPAPEIKAPEKVAGQPFKQKEVAFKDVGKFVMSLARDLEGNVWVGTEDQGVFRYTAKGDGADDLTSGKWTQFTGIGDDNAYAITCDQLGRVWVGTLNHGVNVYNGKEWRNYDVLDGPIGERIFAIAICPTDGDVWMASSAGLTRYSMKNESWSYYTGAEGLPEDQASAVAFDPQGNIYVGTQCHGVATAKTADDYKKWAVVAGPAQLPVTPTGTGLPTGLINALLVAGDGTVYGGTTAGLAFRKPRAQTWQYTLGRDYAAKVKGRWGGPPKDWQEAPKQIMERLLPEDYVTCLAESDGLLWIGFRQQGYMAIDVKSNQPVVQVANKGPELPDEYVTVILPAAASRPWLGTYGGGVGRAKQAVESVRARYNAEPVAKAGKELPPLPAPTKVPALAELQTMLQDLSKTPAAPPSGARPIVVALADDWRTQGNFYGESQDVDFRYGEWLAVLCAHSSPFDATWGSKSSEVLCAARVGSHGQPGEALRHWVHWAKTNNVRCLKNPHQGERRQAEWDDHKEAYPLTHEGPGMFIDVALPAGTFYLSLYFHNKDGHTGPNRLRDYMITVKPYCKTDAEFARAPTLARARVRDFWGGVYKTFAVSSGRGYTVQIHPNWSFNTIVSGVFVDPIVHVDKGDGYPSPIPRERLTFKPGELEKRNGLALETTVTVPIQALAALGALSQQRSKAPLQFAVTARQQARPILKALLGEETQAVFPEVMLRGKAECYHLLRLFDQRDGIYKKLPDDRKALMDLLRRIGKEREQKPG